MEAGETHLDMLAKPNQGGEGVRERKREKGEKKKKGSWNWGVGGTTSPQRHLVPPWRNCSLARWLAFRTLDFPRCRGEAGCCCNKPLKWPFKLYLILRGDEASLGCTEGLFCFLVFCFLFFRCFLG